LSFLRRLEPRRLRDRARCVRCSRASAWRYTLGGAMSSPSEVATKCESPRSIPTARSEGGRGCASTSQA
jgi:hypothetical protein